MQVTKYCYKYVFKRPDEAVVVIDEIDQYLSHRVLSVGEAVWRILGLRLHQEYPPVHRLDLHLPKQHRVTFHVGEVENVWADVEGQTSTLLEWFRLNQLDVNARQYKCVCLRSCLDFCNHWVTGTVRFRSITCGRTILGSRVREASVALGAFLWWDRRSLNCSIYGVCSLLFAELPVLWICVHTWAPFT